MALSDIVNVQVSTTVQGLTQAGFGTMLILSPSPSWVERTRTYDSLSELDDDFAVTTPEYLAAQKALSQSPKVKQIKVGRLANKPTQKRTITPTVLNNTVYRIRVGSVWFSYTSDASATAAEIVAGLIALINAGTDNLTATGTTTLVLTANSPGLWDAVEIENPALLSLMQDHVDPGVATDLAAIANEDNDWYCIINLYNSEAMANAIAAWAESNGKIFICATQDTECATVASGSATDVMKDTSSASYFRTSVWYHPANDAFLDAAVAGKHLPLDPGSETWALHNLASVPSYTITSTHRTNIRAKHGNFYAVEGGLAVTFDGKMASGEWIDVTRFLDWYKARLQERIFSKLVSADKLPMTDTGIAILEAEINAQNDDGIEAGGISSTPAPVVIVPLASDISPADRALRKVAGIETTWTLAGAVHLVDPITVLVST